MKSIQSILKYAVNRGGLISIAFVADKSITALIELIMMPD